MLRLRRVLIANRGEIALRCIHACQKLSLTSVALFTPADAASLHIRIADESILLDDEGPSAYTDIDAILEICLKSKVDAVFPGYGFLSENVEFSRRVEEAGMVFVGPSADSIQSMGLKHTARELAIAAGVPVIPGSGLLTGPQTALEAARVMGFPVMLKASGGGGGMGQQICYNENEISTAFESVEGRSKQLFKDSGVFLERYYPSSHHIEVQVFGNGSQVIHFGERECSIQRRHQKVIEESPSPYLSNRPDLFDRLTSCAVSLGNSINYKSAGTVEFLVDDESGEFFFLEMNTRLQVEHGITEMCYGVDIVSLMLRQADYELAGQNGIPSQELQELQSIAPQGAAIEARICCEDPANNFLPTSGVVQELAWSDDENIRIDTWIQAGTSVSPYFDSLLAKIMVHRDTRDQAIAAMDNAISSSRIGGVTTNLMLVKSIITSKEFRSGITLTTFLDDVFQYRPLGMRIEDPGALTTVQQSGGRNAKGYGIPPSGPLDDLSATIANLLVGNPDNTECLEVTTKGPIIFFHTSAVVAVTGATFPIEVESQPQPMWSSFIVQSNQALKIGASGVPGARCYIAIRGGFPRVPTWLGSKSTTPSLNLGGIQGRPLRQGDFIDLIALQDIASFVPMHLPSSLIPDLQVDKIHVMHGPHDTDDFITASGRETIYSSTWKIGHNSSRTGIRLIGPKVEWSRPDGGRAGGAHPSNVVDYPYPSPGGINWTGDDPVIFPSDGPGFGGFLCSSTVVSAELWKLGQLKPGDEVKFTPISYNAARNLASEKLRYLSVVRDFTLRGGYSGQNLEAKVTDHLDFTSDANLLSIAETKTHPRLTLRQGGDRFVLVDIGSQEASLLTSVWANLLARKLEDIVKPCGYVHINISSVMVEFDPDQVSQSTIIEYVESAWNALEMDDKVISCRRLILPIVFDHPSIQEAEQRYMTLQREKAVYLPDNVSYLQHNNALPKREAVFDILRNTRFLTVAVGFMTGLPLLLPLDPSGRLTAQKYNPTRISTPPGTVGFGGALFCIYSANQPGGYMMAARSLPMWDTYALRHGFESGKPWLCQPFDLVEFEEVDIETYDKIYKDFENGTYKLRIEDTVFDAKHELKQEYEAADLPQNQEFRRKQHLASQGMRLRELELYEQWQKSCASAAKVNSVNPEMDDSKLFRSPHTGKVWKIVVKPGDVIRTGQILAVLESMKMEIPVVADVSHDGSKVEDVVANVGSLLSTGDALFVLG